MAFTAGDQLGHYMIRSLIGRGGMGEVFRAHDTRLGRDVAIKILPAAMARDPDRLARFEREAKVLASLNHPNIAQIYGVEQNALVMELVEGEPPKGPLAFEDAWKIARQIADALDYAHERGVMHRDLKPANVKVTAEGVVKLLDFGLAKAFSGVPDPSGSDPENSPTVTLGGTVAGTILGTAAYMAPEQARGKKVDKRADIWAWGVVLWELLTGERMFKGEDAAETLAAVIHKQPDLDRAPAQVRKLLRRCLEKDPKQRLRDIGEARYLLEEPKLPAEVSAPAGRAAQLLRLGWVAAAVLLTAFAGLAVVHFRERPPERQVLRYTLATPEKTSFMQFTISPDGRYVVLASAPTTEGGLWVRSLDSLENRPLAGTDTASYPFWSPDSRYIGFFTRDGKLKKISVSGGPAQVVCDAPLGRGGTWNQDSVIVFASNNTGGLSRVQAGGGTPVPVTKAESGSHRIPTFLPDGHRFLFAAVTGNNNGIYLASLDSNETRRLITDASYATYFNGHVLFARDTTLMAQPVDPKTLEFKGDIFPVAEQVSRIGDPGDARYSISGNGILIYQTGARDAAVRRRHVWFDRTGKELGAAGGAVPSSNDFALSPEGKRLITQRPAQRSGQSDLWITDFEHGTDGRFTFDPSINTFPVWSPDGTEVVVSSDRNGGTFNLFVSNGSGRDELLYASNANKVAWDWSRDSRFIVFRDRNVSPNILALPIIREKNGKEKAGQPIPLAPGRFNQSQGQLSTDSKWLAFTSDESGRPEIYVVPFAPAFDKPVTGKWPISTGGGAEPRWRGDSKELFYVAADGKLMSVDIRATDTTFDRGVPKALFELPLDTPPNLNFFDYAPRADGNQFLIRIAAGPGTQAPPLTVVVNWLTELKK